MEATTGTNVKPFGPPEPRPAPAVPSQQKAHASNVGANIDMIAAFVIKQIDAVEARCGRMRKETTDDCAAEKASVLAYAERAERTLAELQEMDAGLARVESERKKLTDGRA